MISAMPRSWTLSYTQSESGAKEKWQPIQTYYGGVLLVWTHLNEILGKIDMCSWSLQSSYRNYTTFHHGINLVRTKFYLKRTKFQLGIVHHVCMVSTAQKRGWASRCAIEAGINSKKYVTKYFSLPKKYCVEHNMKIHESHKFIVGCQPQTKLEHRETYPSGYLHWCWRSVFLGSTASKQEVWRRQSRQQVYILY